MNTKSNKKTILIAICVIEALIIIASIIFLITINNNNSDSTSSHKETEEPYEDMAFEDAISESNLIIEGVFIGQHEKDGYYELEFEVKDEYLGSYTDSTIVVYATPETECIDSNTFYVLDYDQQYEEDETYILFLQRIVSVYYDTDRYMPVGEIIYPINDPEAATMNGEPVDSEAHKLVSQLSDASTISRLNAESNPGHNYVGVEYSDATNLGDIAKYADYALKVKISEYVYDNDSLGTTAYTCEVLDNYSGPLTDTMIIVNFFNGTVDFGEEYIVLLNRAGEGSIVYTLAAKENSVLEVNEHNINSVVFNISVSLLEESTPPIPFTDIGMYDWYSESVAYVYGVGLMNGTAERLFSPDEMISREDVVVILGRLDELLGHKRTISSTPFTDVTNQATYYHRYVGWAYTNGIVNGISDTEFGVDLPVTRQDFCVMLYRYAEFSDAGMKLTGNVSFLDALEISSYATEAVSSCANGGIINGYGDGTFGPQNSIKRAEVAQMITKYIQLYIN